MGWRGCCPYFYTVARMTEAAAAHECPPSFQTSFFQMAASALRVSMSHWHAANASPRWAVATAIRTDGSPTATRPRRCSITSR